MSNETAGYLAEFNALRSEILKRIEQRQQIIVVTQGIAILIGFSNPAKTILDWILLGLACLAVCLVIWLVSQTRKKDLQTKPA
jgi:hypothetical protein